MKKLGHLYKSGKTVILCTQDSTDEKTLIGVCVETDPMWVDGIHHVGSYSGTWNARVFEPVGDDYIIELKNTPYVEMGHTVG